MRHTKYEKLIIACMIAYAVIIIIGVFASNAIG